MTTNDRALFLARLLIHDTGAIIKDKAYWLMEEAGQAILDLMTEECPPNAMLVEPDAGGLHWLWVTTSTGGEWRMVMVYLKTDPKIDNEPPQWRYRGESAVRICRPGKWLKIIPPPAPKETAHGDSK